MPGHVIGEAVVDVLAEAGLADELAVVVSLVGKTLGVELAVPRHPTPRSSLIEVVSACERYQDGMQALAGAVAFMRPGSPESERVRELVERPRVLDLLPRADRDRLHQWLAGLEVPRLGELVHRASGLGSPLPPQVRTVWEAFTHLADFNADVDGIPPAFALLELVARRCGGELARQLTEWNDYEARRLRLEAQLKARRASIAMPEREGRLHLMVLVDHDGIDPDLYQVSHWCQRLPGEWPPPHGGTSEVRSADLERYVDSLVVAAERIWADHRGSVALEFVLPRALLNLPVHLWHREHESGMPRPLSIDYLISVRSLERMRSKHWHRVWNQHWEAFMANPSAECVYYENGTQAAALDVVLSDLKWGLVVLGSAPPLEAGGEKDSLTAALRSGIPAVLWHPDAPLDVLRELITEFAKGQSGLGDLPMQAKKSRHASLPETTFHRDNPVRDLVVMWDDPSRLVLDQPPAFPWQRGDIRDDRERAS
ncbi:hypothetical protein [Amycolatopsis sp. NPDC051102]|uniref:VMAP-C domain-containing protein n=1 Tax=Amycolatopsis sp. NPDC051102 TaxID=3155163 RepID=UPI003416FCB4